MNREETKKAIEVMQAYVDGADIEHEWDKCSWHSCGEPDWNFETCDYRIKPKPREWWIRVRKSNNEVMSFSQIKCDDVGTYKSVKVREIIE